jgi:hypothetical protein
LFFAWLRPKGDVKSELYHPFFLLRRVEAVAEGFKR